MRHVQNSSMLYPKMVLPCVQVCIECIIVTAVYTNHTIAKHSSVLHSCRCSIVTQLLLCFFFLEGNIFALSYKHTLIIRILHLTYEIQFQEFYCESDAM